MATRLEKLAEYYRKKGFEVIARKTDMLASEARAVGMPDFFPKHAPRGSEEAKRKGRKEPKGPVFTSELAQQLKASGGALNDDVCLCDLRIFDPEVYTYPLAEWQQELQKLNRTQRVSLINAIDILWNTHHSTIGHIREASLEDLASVRWGAGLPLGMKRANFFKDVFQVDEQREIS